MMSNDAFLQHYGILGMRWGIRRGPRIGFTKSRQKAYIEKDLKRLESGKHLSIGLTKKREKYYDERDLKLLKDKKAKLDGKETKSLVKDIKDRINKRKENKLKKTENDSEDHLAKVELKRKKLSQLSNAELKKLNERMQLEKQYKDLTKTEVSSGRKFVTRIVSNSSEELAKGYIKGLVVKALKR